jgi:hypothetical protein
MECNNLLYCKTCIDGKYIGLNGTCFNCHTDCLTCTGGSNTTCTSCKSGKYLYQNVCYAVCPTLIPPVYVNSFERTCELSREKESYNLFFEETDFTSINVSTYFQPVYLIDSNPITTCVN